MMSHSPHKKMVYETLPRRTLIVWEILSAMFCILLYLLLAWVTPSHTLIRGIVLWLVGAIFILSGLLYLPLLYLNVQYRLGKEEVVLKSGLFVEKNQVMRRCNISFVTQYIAPFSRLFRLSGLVIHAPGSKLRLLFIDEQSAQHIREQIDKGFDTPSNRCTQEGTS